METKSQGKVKNTCATHKEATTQLQNLPFKKKKKKKKSTLESHQFQIEIVKHMTNSVFYFVPNKSVDHKWYCVVSE